MLATVHIPLADVARALTADVLAETIRITAASLPAFGVPRPRIAVAGLNPHAGEHGLMGDEDDRVIAPTVAQLPGGRHRRHRADSRRHRFPARHPRRVRRRRRLLSRSGADSREAARVRHARSTSPWACRSSAPRSTTERRSTSPGGAPPMRRASSRRCGWRRASPRRGRPAARSSNRPAARPPVANHATQSRRDPASGSSPTTARPSTTTRSSRRSRLASCCSAPR